LIEILYLVSGMLLPLFYLPQILRLQNDATKLASFSLLKAVTQLFLRLPVLLFSYVIVGNVFMNVVVTADVLGRAIECLAACRSLRRQGADWAEIKRRLNPSYRVVESSNTGAINHEAT
jgi:hypothetical protein